MATSSNSLFFASFLFGLSNSYTWNCNHYNSYATNVCYQYSTSVEYKFVCNASNSINKYEYSSGDCDTSNSVSQDKSISSSITNYKTINSDDFQCDQSHACDYNRVIYYSNEDCTLDNGGTSYDWEHYIVDKCYPSSVLSFVSYKYECNDDTLETTTYSSGNCTGYSVSSKVTFNDNYNTKYKGCYQLICSTSNGKSDKTFIFGLEWWAVLIICIFIVCGMLICLILCRIVKKRKIMKQQLIAMQQDDDDEDDDNNRIPIEMIENDNDNDDYARAERDDDVAPGPAFAYVGGINSGNHGGSNEGYSNGESGSSNHR